jgi:uncharacterized protein (DUF58 family)
MWQTRDKLGWRNFGVAMLVLSAALLIALFSAAVAQQGRILAAAISTVVALSLAAWVAVAIVPNLARRTSFRWVVSQIDYKLTREGMVYLGVIGILILASVNTGNNLLFMILACSLAGIVMSGVLSRAVLTGVELKFDMPEHVFAEQPVMAELELRNGKEFWPSFSLRVAGKTKKGLSNEILTRPVFFPYIPGLSSARQKVELNFPRRGSYRQDAFGIQTRFPFGFFEKTRTVESQLEILVYPRVEPTDQFYEVLPLLSGEMASNFRGRGHELHSLRDYLPTDSARFVDWKVTARAGHMVVREFAREDERRVMLVLDPFIGEPHAQQGGAAKVEPATPAATEHAEKFERAVVMAACIAWHFNEINSALQFRTNRFATPMAPAGEIIYDALRELAIIKPDNSVTGGKFLDDLANDREIFKIIITARPQHTIPTALWSSSYFVFIDSL